MQVVIMRTLLITVAVTCHIRSVVGLARAHHARSVGVSPGSVHEYAFLTFHKSGTYLSRQLAHTAAPVLNLAFKLDFVESGHNSCETCETGRTCYPNAVAVYSDEANLRALEGCPDLRAVVVVRRPSTMMISDYAYTKELSPLSVEKSDYIRLRDTTAIYNALPLSDGIKHECWKWLAEIAPNLREYVQNKTQFSNVLQVSLEDFTNNYDNTTRSVFEHFLGSNDPRVDDLVELAKAHDLNRLNSTQLDSALHTASHSLEAHAAIEVEKQLQAGDPCMQQVAEMDELLGYSPPF